jgi:hypothetical protein
MRLQKHGFHPSLPDCDRGLISLLHCFRIGESVISKTRFFKSIIACVGLQFAILCSAQIPQIIAMAPNPAVFPAQTIGTSSPAQVITVTNISTDPIRILTVAYDGTICLPLLPCPGDPPGFHDFTFTSDCLAAPLQPSGTCSVNVTFTPTGAGLRRSRIFVDAPTTLFAIASVSLSGTGISPIPTMTQFGLFLLGALLLISALRRVRR